MKTSSKKQDRTRYPLPDPVDDGSRICVKLYIPNIDGHRQALIGAIYNLTRWYSWSYDDAKTGREVAAVWKPIFYEMMETFYDGCPDDNPCFEFPPSAPFIEWFPNNPYTEPDLITAGYNAPAWYEATPLSNLILGTQTGDIVTDLSRFPPGSLPTVIPASGLPRFRVNLVGPGLVRLHLLNLVAGSLAQITIDDDIGTIRFIDTNRDQLAVPFETATTTIEEVEVLGAGPHHIDVIVVSQLNDAIPFLHHGGGLRKVEICGEAADMPFYELRTNPDDPCSVQQRLTATGEWTEAFRMDNCCTDDTPAQQRYTDQGILETSPDGVTWTPRRDLDPRFNAPILPPSTTPPGDELRCEAATNAQVIIKARFIDDLEESFTWTGITSTIGAAIAAFIPTAGASALGALVIAGLMLAGSVTVLAAFTTEVWETFMCILYCRMNADGRFDETGWQAVKADINDQLGGIAAVILHDTVNSLGPAGLTNAARTPTGVVGDCDCPECPECFSEDDIQIGTFVDIGADGTGNFIQITSAPATHNTITAEWVVFGGAEFCCYYGSFLVTDGAISAGGLLDCDGNPHVGEGNISFAEFYHATTPFTIKFYFA